MPTRIRFKSISRSKLDINANVGALIPGDTYLLNDELCIAIPITSSNYGIVPFTEIREFNYAGYLFFNNPFSNNIERLQFSDDTISIIYNELYDGFVERGVSSKKTGYLGSNENKNIRKLSFITEVLSSLFFTLSVNRYYTSSIESSTNGYWCGGQTSENNVIDFVDKLNFDDEVLVSNSIVINKITQSEGSSNNEKGFLIGGRGEDLLIQNTITGISFQNDVPYILSDTLRIPAYLLSCTESFESSYVTGFGSNDNRIEKLNFTTDSINTLQISINNNIRFCEGISSNNCGYWCGGKDLYLNIDTNEINKMQFFTDTILTSHVMLIEVGDRITSVQCKKEF